MLTAVSQIIICSTSHTICTPLPGNYMYTVFDWARNYRTFPESGNNRTRMPKNAAYSRYIQTHTNILHRHKSERVMSPAKCTQIENASQAKTTVLLVWPPSPPASACATNPRTHACRFVLFGTGALRARVCARIALAHHHAHAQIGRTKLIVCARA